MARVHQGDFISINIVIVEQFNERPVFAIVYNTHLLLFVLYFCSGSSLILSKSQPQICQGR